MPYCQHCGGEVDTLPGMATAEEREPMEVTLARIQADRDVQVARIEASAHRAELATAETIAETEADAQVDAAEAVAEIITAQAEDSEPEPDGDPIVVETPAAEPEPAPEPDMMLPAAEPHEPREKPAGWWDGYR